MRIGIIHEMDIEIYNSLLHVARSLRPIKAKEDSLRLKEHRHAKSLKEELSLKKEEKSCEGYFDILFLWNLHEDGKFWRTEQQVEEELLKISGIKAKRNALKEKITIYVKGLEFI